MIDKILCSNGKKSIFALFTYNLGMFKLGDHNYPILSHPELSFLMIFFKHLKCEYENDFFLLALQHCSRDTH